MALQIALVSIGKIARDQHIPAISESPDWTLAAAVSRNAKVEGVQNFAEMSDMLAQCPEIPVVSLCMPPAARFDYAAAAIDAGRHVMLEKPPGATLSECHELRRMAEQKGVTLFATWHSRFAAQVPAAKEWMRERSIRKVTVTWKEDVRRWHPGQDWIWKSGGLGVFDPGINALSILTEIMPRAVFIKHATLEFPMNSETPIAAELQFADPGGAAISMILDWRQEGPQTWDILVETDSETMLLSDGGATLTLNGKLAAQKPDQEYAALYARMADLVRSKKSDVDLSPMTHVADAFMLGQRRETEAFHW